MTKDSSLANIKHAEADRLSDEELSSINGGTVHVGLPDGAMVAKGPGLLVWSTATAHGYIVDTSGKVPK